MIKLEINGIDVSVYQGDISWPTVESTGKVKFAMIKATFGKTGIDPKFTTNITGISSTNIYAGAYHYFTAQTPSEAITEANHFINTVKPYMIAYPLALSLINEDLIPLGKQRLTENVIAFLNAISNSNYKPILFTNLGFINNYLDMDKLSNTDIWLAEWGPKPTYAKNVTMWQRSNNGKIYGIDTDVSLDISYKNYADDNNTSTTTNIDDYIRNNPSNNREIAGTSNEKIVENAEKNMNSSSSRMEMESTQNLPTNGTNNMSVMKSTINTDFYTVKSGETLRDIAQKILGDAEKFYEIMELNDLKNQNIYAGQTLRIPQKFDNRTFLYRVKRGDTLWQISEKYLKNGSNYRQIMAINGLTNDMIYPGQILKISVQQ